MFEIKSYNNNIQVGLILRSVKKNKFQICNFQKRISENKRAFVKLMTFTKQNSVYLADDKEYLSIFSDHSAEKYGYMSKNNRVRSLLKVILSVAFGKGLNFEVALKTFLRKTFLSLAEA